MPHAQALLISRLLENLPGARLVETHISWVIVAGDFAYKLKKPVNLGFLDFSTPEKRRFCCEEEIRLNRRLAPDIYLEALPVTGTPTAPMLGGEGVALDWAVKMRAFPADATLDKAARLDHIALETLAARIARFHRDNAAAPADSHYGAPERVRQPIAENFAQLRALPLPAAAQPLLDALQTWSQREGARLEAHFAARRQGGFIRECHGDLHLGNIAWVNDAPLIFDGIEFNADLRFIDVISEIAFLVMDLIHRQAAPLAWRFLNHYLEHSGDYAGLTGLRYYLGYRALVRAKVAAIRAAQAAPPHDFAECLTYLHLAQTLIQVHAPALLLMHGVSGSGKSVISQSLLETLGAIRLRSDVERKRLFGLEALQRSTPPRSTASGDIHTRDIYTRNAGELTRAHLWRTSDRLLAEGFCVIVDATFISPAWRTPFTDLARKHACPWLLISPQVDLEELRRRVMHRQQRGNDASEADVTVLEAQWQTQIPLDAEEAAHAVPVTPGTDLAWLATSITQRLQTPPPSLTRASP